MLTQTRLKELLSYDETNGDFIWLVSRQGSGRPGQIAGHVTRSGYRRIRIDRSNYFAHRLVWLYIHGEFPSEGLQIDHINRSRLDNRLSNLRLVSGCENSQNTGKQINNTSGYKGVTRRKNRYEANIYHAGKLHYLGSYETAEDASNAYETKSLELRGALVKKAMEN